MDRIILEVEDTTARRWRYISQEKRAELTNAFNRIVKKIADDNSDEDFFGFLDKLSRSAAANGLTEEKLNELLNEE